MVAHGFLTSVHKWLTVIRLLLGEIPERSELAVPGTDGTLRPYLSLATAVRSGDVTAFNTVALSNSDVFLSDQTHNLINRLRYNVLRAGLRRISLAYSRISLQVMFCQLPGLHVSPWIWFASTGSKHLHAQSYMIVWGLKSYAV